MGADNRENVLIFDVETTGSNPAHDQIIELSMKHGLQANSPVITRRYKPNIPIGAEAQKVHGISAADLADCPAFKDQAAEIRKLFDSSAVFMAYNIAFDLPLLQTELVRAGCEPVSLQGKLLLDPFQIWKTYEPRTLEAAYARFVGGEHETAHSAEGDVEATVKVFHGMLEHFKLHSRSWQELHAATFPSTSIGFSAHLQWKDGVPIFTFGKQKGRPVWKVSRDDRSYLEWLMKQDFPYHVTDVCKHAIAMEEAAFHVWLRESYGTPA